MFFNTLYGDYWPLAKLVIAVASQHSGFFSILRIVSARNLKSELRCCWIVNRPLSFLAMSLLKLSTQNIPAKYRLSGVIFAVFGALTGISSCHADSANKTNSFGNVSAQTVPVYKVYKYRQADGVPAFSDAVPYNQSYEIMEFSCYACNPNSNINWKKTRLFTDEYARPISLAAATHGVDPALIRAVIHAESGFNSLARSRKGAIGLMQLMPGTANDMGVNPDNTEENIKGGVKYLALLLGQFKGDITLATAAYNAGPGAVTKYNGIPPFSETQTYVKRVKLLHERYKTQS
jgi:soluble lytic murein transglycosylase-like protein